MHNNDDYQFDVSEYNIQQGTQPYVNVQLTIDTTLKSFKNSNETQ